MNSSIFKISAIAFACLLAACGKVGGDMSTESSKTNDESQNESVQIVSKHSLDSKVDLSQTKQLSAIAPQALVSLLTYTTGIGDPSSPWGAVNPRSVALSVERAKLKTGKSFDSLDFMLSARQYSPAQPINFSYSASKGLIFEPSKSFFYGEGRSPLKMGETKTLDWQQQATDGLKKAKSDMQIFCDQNREAVFAAAKAGRSIDGVLPALPPSVILWQLRYNALFNILHTYEAGGIFYARDQGGYELQLSKSQENEVLDGVVSTEYASRVMGRVISRSTKSRAVDFMELRSKILQAFLDLTEEQFFEELQATKLAYKQLANGVYLNNDKGAQFGQVVYKNEAGKNSSWQKLDSGAVIYDSSTVNGVQYVLTATNTKTTSREMSNDLKLTSDLKESVGAKVGVNASVSSENPIK